MNRRIKKKLHKKYLNDILCDISLDKFWRRRLFESEVGETFLISRKTIDELPLYLQNIFKKNNLKYLVRVLDDDSQKYGFDEGLIIFEVSAADIRSLKAYSGNSYTHF